MNLRRVRASSLALAALSALLLPYGAPAICAAAGRMSATEGPAANTVLETPAGHGCAEPDGSHGLCGIGQCGLALTAPIVTPWHDGPALALRALVLHAPFLPFVSRTPAPLTPPPEA